MGAKKRSEVSKPVSNDDDFEDVLAKPKGPDGVKPFETFESKDGSVKPFETFDSKKNDEATDSLADFLDVPDRSPKLSNDFEEILAVTFVPTANAKTTYDELEAALYIGEQRGDRATVNASLDAAERNSRRAFRLYLTAKIEVARFEKDRDVIVAAMRSHATRELQAEKDSGSRAKAITEADVRMKAAELHPDEWGALEERSARVEAMQKSMEHLAEAWKSRARSLQAILGGMR